jgi:hypothetical protein
LTCSSLQGYTLIDFARGSFDKPLLQLSVYPSSGVFTENIEVDCRIRLDPSTMNSDNVYLSVQTDNVKPSGILLMVDDRVNQCRINREKYIHVTICNRSHIRIRINHTLLNDSLHTIDYVCTKGDVNTISSYRLTSKRDR